MTSVLLPAGTDGLDGVSLSKLTDWTPVAQAGYPWASVYIGGLYGVTRAAIEAAWRAAISLMPNYERAADAAKGGYSSGLLAARTAITQLGELGFLGECPVVFSGSDAGFTDGELAAAMDYHRAIVDTFRAHGLVTGQPWPGGAYGLRKVMEMLAQQAWWPSDWPIWHWGGDGYVMYWWATAKQWYGHKPKGMPPPYDVEHDTSGIPFAFDENTLLKPMRFWSGYGLDTPPPTPGKGDEMSVFRYTPEGYVAEVSMGHKIWITGDYFYGVVQGQLHGSGVTSPVNIYAEPAPLALIQAIPDMPAPGGGGQVINGIRILTVPGEASVY